MNRTATIFLHEEHAGNLSETETGFTFNYLPHYLQSKKAMPVSQTLPLQQNAYTSSVLFPFFDGLIPEGWLLILAEENWKLHSKDRFGLLLACCKSCIGAVSVLPQL
jgi:serine/threonine-protein kinase HipA